MPIKVEYSIINIVGEDKELVMWPIKPENIETKLKSAPEIFIAQEELKSTIKEVANLKNNGIDNKFLTSIEEVSSSKGETGRADFLSPHDDSLSESMHNQSEELNSNDGSFITCEGISSPGLIEGDEVWCPITEAKNKMPLHNNTSPENNPINKSQFNETFQLPYDNEEDTKIEFTISREDISLLDDKMLKIVKGEFKQDEKKTRINIETDSTGKSLSSKLTASQLEDTLPEFNLLEKSTMTPKELTEIPSETTIKNKLSEKDREQVKKDIGRSMNNFDYFNSLNEESAADYKTQLEQMLIELLSKNDFHYYQGYNELCSVFLLILGKKQGSKAAEVTSYYLIKDFLLDSFEKGVQPMLFMLNDLLKVADKELYEAFSQLGVISLY